MDAPGGLMYHRHSRGDGLSSPCRFYAYLQRHPIPLRRHGKSQKSTHSQAGADDIEGEEGKEQGGTSQFIDTQVEQTEVIWDAYYKESPEGRSLLHAPKGVYGKANGEREYDVNTQADSRHKWAKQPEAFAEAFAFG